MFTGIIEETGKITRASPGRLVISAINVLEGLQLGDSLAVNGTCLTVIGFDDSSFSVDVMPETLRRTNLGRLAAGDEVNLERALALGGRLGGHLVQGHIDATGWVRAVRRDGEARLLEVEAPAEVMAYIVEKGFITVDGISLTVTGRGDGSFSVSIVDFTGRRTTIGQRQVGDTVNLEVDIMAKYVEQLTKSARSGVTADFLREHGFLVG
jgi:riboflavin synthase